MTEQIEFEPKNRADRRAMKYKMKHLKAIVSEIESLKNRGLQTHAAKSYGRYTATSNDILRNRKA